MSQFSKTYTTLYGLASTGKFKVWDVRVVGAAGAASPATIVITHGPEGGKQQSTSRHIAEGKNLGKANETTPYEQACLEAESLWKKKQDKGYREKKSDLQKATTVASRLPMLAHKYTERAKSIVWPAYAQPKLNGIRCLMERSGNTIIFHSRGNKQFAPFPLIAAAALRVMYDGDILDGELYNAQVHMGDLSFQELTSMVKDPKHPERNTVQFWNYDVVADCAFSERVKHLRHCGPILPVPTAVVKNDADVKRLHQELTAEGYEGTMIRSGGNDPYRMQYRSTSLLKYKDFVDDDFEIVGAEEGVGKAVGQATFICKTKDGYTFNARCKGSNAVREEQWRNRASYVGKLLTVRYQEFSEDGIPIFPVGIVVRDYE